MTQFWRLALATRRWILFLPLAAMLSALAGCSGGSTANVKNPPPPPETKVAIAFQPTPPTGINVNTVTPLSAVVTNDPSSLGVDWSLSCSVPGTALNKCGTLSALHTASAASTTYTPPTTFAGNSISVTIVAFATADHTQNQTAAMTVTAFGSVLVGTYVLQAQGIDSSALQPYQFAAVIHLDGNGGIVPITQGQPAGEQTVNVYDSTAGALATKSDPITGGSYFLGPDGRGTITINTADTSVGSGGVETFSFVSLSPSQALIAQTDITETASGTMDLQTGAAAPSGGYAFVASGIDLATATPTSMGGVFNIDSPNTISGKGSIADQNLAGTLTTQQKLTGTISNPDAFGAVTLTLTVPGFPNPNAAPIQFTGYIVDSTHVKLVESDNSNPSTTPGFGSTGGVAIGQGSSTGTFLGDAAFSGTYVFGVPGVDLTGTAPDSFTSVGLFTADGSGGLANGFTDTFFLTNCAQASCTQQGITGAQISATFSGGYVIDTKGTGRVRVNFTNLVPFPKPFIGLQFFIYLTGNGTPALVLDGSDSSPIKMYPSLGTGMAYLQSAPPLTFSGDYGFNFTQVSSIAENDGTGQMTANSATGVLSEVADINAAFGFQSDTPFTDSFSIPIPANGVFPGTFNGTAAVDYYMIDPGHGFFVETDLTNPNAPSAVVSIGYFAVRTPVCVGCP